MLGMPRAWDTQTYQMTFNGEGQLEEMSKEDFHSTTTGAFTSHSWYNKPRYNTKGEKAIHQRLKKKLEERKKPKVYEEYEGEDCWILVILEPDYWINYDNPDTSKIWNHFDKSKYTIKIKTDDYFLLINYY